jgi:hypothetical protein
MGEQRLEKRKEMRREEDGRSRCAGRPNRVILIWDSVRHVTLMTRQEMSFEVLQLILLIITRRFKFH